MISIEMLRKQHADIMEQVDTILKAIRGNEVVLNKELVQELVTKISDELRLHLLVEDDLLYPALMKDPKESIRNIAYMYVAELGGIKDTFKKYKAKWTRNEAIAESIEAFKSETEALITLLKKRIDKENNELFPLFENRTYRIGSVLTA